MNRPKIICHMVSSIDGRLHANRWTPIASGNTEGTAYRIYEQVAAKFEADAWVVGRVTMQDYTTGTEFASDIPAGNLRETFLGNRQSRRLAIAVDPHGKLIFGADQPNSDHMVSITSTNASAEYLATLRRDEVSYLFAGEDGRDLSVAMETLADHFNVRTLLLEGGGILNGAFLKAGLVDEISLLVYPGIDGLSGIPSIFEYMGVDGEKPADGLQLRTLDVQLLEEGFVWIRYAVEPAPAKSTN